MAMKSPQNNVRGFHWSEAWQSSTVIGGLATHTSSGRSVIRWLRMSSISGHPHAWASQLLVMHPATPRVLGHEDWGPHILPHTAFSFIEPAMQTNLKQMAALRLWSDFRGGGLASEMGDQRPGHNGGSDPERWPAPRMA